MISDLYPKEERSSAMALYALGVYFGIMIGFLVGGFVADAWGWRAAFFIVGIPGLLIALLVRFTMIEPPRGFADGVAPPPKGKINIRAGMAVLWRVRTTRHVVIGVTLTALVGYGTIVWNPAFLMRSHGLSPTQVGVLLGPLLGVVGGLGAWIGGILADRLAAKNQSWNAWIVGLAKILAIPFIIAFYTIDNTYLALAAYIPAVFLGAFYLGPSFAMIQSLTPLRSRALASAVMLLVLNLFGLGFGPQLIGLTSDLIGGLYGMESLRYALIAAALVNIWACWHTTWPAVPSSRIRPTWNPEVPGGAAPSAPPTASLSLPFCCSPSVLAQRRIQEHHRKRASDLWWRVSDGRCVGLGNDHGIPRDHRPRPAPCDRVGDGKALDMPTPISAPRGHEPRQRGHQHCPAVGQACRRSQATASPRGYPGSKCG